MLGDTTRVRILDALVALRAAACATSPALLGLSESAVSHQLRLLRGMRLVRRGATGRMVFYTLDDQHIVGLFEQGLRARRRRMSPRRSAARMTTTCTVCELHAESTFKVEGMDCREEVALIERRFKNLPGLEDFSADLMGQRLHVKYDAAKLSAVGDRRRRRRRRHARLARARGAGRPATPTG